MALVTLIDREVQIIKARAGTDLEETPRSLAFAITPFAARRRACGARCSHRPTLCRKPLVKRASPLSGLRRRAADLRESIRLGALCLIDPQPRGFTPGDRAELAAMADEVVVRIIEQEVEAKMKRVGISDDASLGNPVSRTLKAPQRHCHVWMGPFCIYQFERMLISVRSGHVSAIGCGASDRWP
jgi:hypothetical protein